ncbi:MAG: hypothetical protein M3Q49_06895 [Actinomycetota bacterium]|nr:hypothetical protein [Actinomycetota bacterium]MDP9485505.1 hypothetical protein [Actinomycetota bacterium]
MLRARSNAYRDLEPLVEESMRAIVSATPGTVVRVPPEADPDEVRRAQKAPLCV